VARFYFHIYNGRQMHDDIGSECADAAAVRAEAVETLAEMAHGNLLKSKDASSCFINVVDAAGRTVMIANLAASVEAIQQGSSM
jgi:hypothetical protein